MTDSNDETGFNDAELADIMSEIEGLEEEFANEAENTNGPEAASVSQETHEVEKDEPKASAQENEKEDTVNEAQAILDSGPVEEAQTEVQEKVAVTQVAPPENVVPLQPKASRDSYGSCSHSQLDFHIEGDMKLELGFHIGGQTIGLHINGEEGLVIKLEGGASFNVPLSTQQTLSKKVSSN